MIVERPVYPSARHSAWDADQAAVQGAQAVQVDALDAPVVAQEHVPIAAIADVLAAVMGAI